MHSKYTRNIRNLPTLPTVLTKIIATLDDPKSSVGDLERIIRYDQALTAKLLAISNSPYYGFRHEITSVSRAVVAIGYNEVRNLCMGLGLMNFLHPSGFKDVALAEQLWLHSLLTSEASRILSDRIEKTDAEMAFTAGLMHDIGKVILAAFFPDEVNVLCRLMEERDYFLLEAEKAMGTSHQEIGQLVAKKWKLPEVFPEVIGNHHEPRSYKPYFQICSVVHVADHLARDVGILNGWQPDAMGIHQQARDGLDLKEDDLDFCLDALESRKPAVIALWENMINSKVDS